VAKRFKPLEPGEPIGVVALSGPVDRDRLSAGLDVLRAWGHPLIPAPNLDARSAYLAGGDEQRLAGLEHVVERGARVVLAARGGYGVTRLLPHLELGELVRRGLMLIGYSDITALMNGLVAAGSGPQVHGPMAAAGLVRDRNGRRLRALLEGELVDMELFRVRPSQVVRGGRVRGRAVGGNLAMLEATVGTPFEARFAGGLLFLEEVGEARYRLDRMLTHLRTSGRLRGVKALICGSLHDCRPVHGRSAWWRELVTEVLGPGVPVVVDLPFGHGARNLAFPLGAELELDTDRGTIRWRG
jgi:muramoyltetrapeptide carboxypeptidase